VRERLREDEEFILYRGRATGAELPSVLFLTLASKRPALESLTKIKHEYSLRNELDSAWASSAPSPFPATRADDVRARRPGDETLDRFLPEPLEMTRFLRLAVGIATAVGGVHKRELIHKDVKPASSSPGDAQKLGGNCDDHCQHMRTPKDGRRCRRRYSLGYALLPVLRREGGSA
jgi:hypothetical protein